MKRTLIAAAAATLLITTDAQAGRGFHFGGGFRGGHIGHGHIGRGWHGGHGHGRGFGWGGFIAGTIIGGAIGAYARPYYAEPPPVYYVPRPYRAAPLYVPINPYGAPAYAPPCCVME